MMRMMMKVTRGVREIPVAPAGPPGCHPPPPPTCRQPATCSCADRGKTRRGTGQHEPGLHVLPTSTPTFGGRSAHHCARSSPQRKRS
eukprot:4484408-Heterocapsa_arctica.AAC.1